MSRMISSSHSPRNVLGGQWQPETQRSNMSKSSFVLGMGKPHMCNNFGGSATTATATSSSAVEDMDLKLENDRRLQEMREQGKQCLLERDATSVQERGAANLLERFHSMQWVRQHHLESTAAGPSQSTRTADSNRVNLVPVKYKEEEYFPGTRQQKKTRRVKNTRSKQESAKWEEIVPNPSERIPPAGYHENPPSAWAVRKGSDLFDSRKLNLTIYGPQNYNELLQRACEESLITLAQDENRVINMFSQDPENLEDKSCSNSTKVGLNAWDKKRDMPMENGSGDTNWMQTIYNRSKNHSDTTSQKEDVNANLKMSNIDCLKSSFNSAMNTERSLLRLGAGDHMYNEKLDRQTKEKSKDIMDKYDKSKTASGNYQENYKKREKDKEKELESLGFSKKRDDQGQFGTSGRREQMPGQGNSTNQEKLQQRKRTVMSVPPMKQTEEEDSSPKRESSTPPVPPMKQTEEEDSSPKRESSTPPGHIEELPDMIVGCSPKENDIMKKMQEEINSLGTRVKMLTSALERCNNPKPEEPAKIESKVLSEVQGSFISKSPVSTEAQKTQPFTVACNENVVKPNDERAALDASFQSPPTSLPQGFVHPLGVPVMQPFPHHSLPAVMNQQLQTVPSDPRLNPLAKSSHSSNYPITDHSNIPTLASTYSSTHSMAHHSVSSHSLTTQHHLGNASETPQPHPRANPEHPPANMLTNSTVYPPGFLLMHPSTLQDVNPSVQLQMQRSMPLQASCPGFQTGPQRAHPMTPEMLQNFWQQAQKNQGSAGNPQFQAQQAQESDVKPQLQAHQAQVSGVNPQLQVQQAQVSDVKPQLLSQQTQVSDVNPVFQAQRAQVPDANPLLQAQRAQVPDVNPLLQAQRAQVPDANPLLQAQQAQVPDGIPLLQAQRAQVSDMNPLLQAQQAQVSNMNPLLQAQQAQVSDVNFLLQAQQAQVSDMNPQLQAQQMQASAMYSMMRAQMAMSWLGMRPPFPHAGPLQPQPMYMGAGPGSGNGIHIPAASHLSAPNSENVQVNGGILRAENAAQGNPHGGKESLSENSASTMGNPVSGVAGFVPGNGISTNAASQENPAGLSINNAPNGDNGGASLDKWFAQIQAQQQHQNFIHLASNMPGMRLQLPIQPAFPSSVVPSSLRACEPNLQTGPRPGNIPHQFEGDWIISPDDEARLSQGLPIGFKEKTVITNGKQQTSFPDLALTSPGSVRALGLPAPATLKPARPLAHLAGLKQQQQPLDLQVSDSEPLDLMDFNPAVLPPQIGVNSPVALPTGVLSRGSVCPDEPRGRGRFRQK